MQMIKPGLLLILGGVAASAFTAIAIAQTKGPAPLVLEGSAARTPWQRYSAWTTRDASQFNTLANQHASPRPRTS